MIKNCLELNQVILPGPPELWAAPLDLTVGLQEVVLIENIGPNESGPLGEMASALSQPVAGEVRHWEQDAVRLPREDLYLLRRRIAYLAPGMKLLSRLTLGENIALGPSYYHGTSTQSVLECYAYLLDRLALRPFLSFLPQDVDIKVYIRALWARELIKMPELIVAVRNDAWEPFSMPNEGILILQDYLAHRGGAALLLGRSHEQFHHLASRLLRYESGRLIPRPLEEHQGRPLTDFLPLVMGEE
jgi:ABC-type ATPase involved in cell division